MNILITRQLDQSIKFSMMLKKANIKNFIFPAITIENLTPSKEDISNIEKSNFIIFTSQNSVLSLAKKYPITNLSGKTIGAIGKSTEEFLNGMNMKVDIVPKEKFTSESLLDEIKKNKIDNKTVLIIKGEGGRDFLNKELRKNNFVLKDCNIYKRSLPNNINEIDNLKFKDVTHVCITSIEIFKNFLKIIKTIKFIINEDITFVCGNDRIGEEVSKIFKNNRILVSDDPSNDKMLKVIIS